MNAVHEDQPDIETILTRLREAVVFERAERTNAPFEAKQQAERRVQAAHTETVALVKAAYEAGATKTVIAKHLGIQNLARVGHLINEGKNQ